MKVHGINLVELMGRLLGKRNCLEAWTGAVMARDLGLVLNLGLLKAHRMDLMTHWGGHWDSQNQLETLKLMVCMKASDSNLVEMMALQMEGH